MSTESGVDGAGTEGDVTLAIDDGVGTIEFSHPKGNSLPGALLRRLAAGIRTLGEDPSARVIVLGSGGTGPFCAGASFDELVNIENEHEGLDRDPELGTIAPINLLQQSDEVRASLGPAGAHDQVAPGPVKHAEHRYFGALARCRNAQVGPFLRPDMREVRVGEGFGLVTKEQHDVTRLGLGFEQLSA